MSRLEKALSLVNSGWAIFPLQWMAETGRCSCLKGLDCSNKGKHPRIEHGRNNSTRDAEQVKKWWTRWPEANIGIATGIESNVFVVDVDGEEGLRSLEERYGPLPQTLTASTANGKHLYFIHPGFEIRNKSKTNFWPDLDVRGDGGYVVAPGSVHHTGVIYEWSKLVPIAEAPSWLLDLVRSQERKYVSPIIVSGWEEDRWGKRVLEAEVSAILLAPIHSRNDTLFTSACKVYEAVKGGHISGDKANEQLALAAERCGLGDDEVPKTLASAWQRVSARHPQERKEGPASYQDGHRRHSGASQSQDNPLVHSQVPLEGFNGSERLSARDRWPVYVDDELDDIPPPEWLVEDILTTEMNVVFGPYGCGKSFLALDWALSVVSGHDWFGKKVRKSPATYIAGEGVSGMPSRRQAWITDRRIKPMGFSFIGRGVNFFRDNGEVNSLIEFLKQQQSRLFIVDTLARCMTGGKEQGEDLSIVIENAERVMREADAACIIVHHSGWADKERPRGGTELPGAVSSIVAVEKTNEIVRVRCEKQKDAPEFLPWEFALKPVGKSAVLSTQITGGQEVDVTALICNALKTGCSKKEDLVRVANGDASIIPTLIRQGRLEDIGEGWVKLGNNGFKHGNGNGNGHH